MDAKKDFQTDVDQHALHVAQTHQRIVTTKASLHPRCQLSTSGEHATYTLDLVDARNEHVHRKSSERITHTVDLTSKPDPYADCASQHRKSAKSVDKIRCALAPHRWSTASFSSSTTPEWLHRHTHRCRRER